MRALLSCYMNPGESSQQVGEEGPEFRPATARITDAAREEITSLCTTGLAKPTSLGGGKYHSPRILVKRENRPFSGFLDLVEKLVGDQLTRLRLSRYQENSFNKCLFLGWS